MHPKQIVNVANGTLGVSQVNVDQAVSIGHGQLLEFEKELPNGFWKSIERKIKTMATSRKGIAIGSKVVYDTELIFSRVFGLQASSREVNFKDVLCRMSFHQSQLLYLMIQVRPFYLCALLHLTCIFLGDMRICKSKADLKKSTRVEVSTRNVDRKNCTVLDGCAILWCIAWPTSCPTNQALVKDFVESFKKYLQQQLRWGDVYLVFDRYIEFSTKYSTRKFRGTGGCRVFQLSASGPLPPPSSHCLRKQEAIDSNHCCNTDS